MEQRQIWVAYMLWFFLGYLGIHKFYLHRTSAGIVYLFTAGVFGVGLLIDLFTLPNQVREFNRKYEAIGMLTGGSSLKVFHQVSEDGRRSYERYR